MGITVWQMPAGSIDDSVSYNGNIIAMIRINTAGYHGTLFDIDRIIRL